MPDPDTGPQPDNLLFDRERLLAALLALLALPSLAGRDVRVFHAIHAYDDGRIKLELLDPERPEAVDEYTFKNGVWKRDRHRTRADCCHAIPRPRTTRQWSGSISKVSTASRRRCNSSAPRCWPIRRRWTMSTC
ncbi:hypothetical protein [Xanthomonas maliensis]|uniref:hypothetical protein n=1 Tax=Xanthomonas maliensis TaxID=1321368 RepID=UPI0003A707E9|nr:hypothetical protein [Xanthomonas maliensis]